MGAHPRTSRRCTRRTEDGRFVSLYILMLKPPFIITSSGGLCNSPTFSTIFSVVFI